MKRVADKVSPDLQGYALARRSFKMQPSIKHDHEALMAKPKRAGVRNTRRPPGRGRANALCPDD